MPQLTLDYSANIPQEVHQEIFLRLHQILNVAGNIHIDNCKSRSIRRENFFIGDGDPQNAFVHLEIRFLEGRSPELKQAIGKACLEVLEIIFKQSMETLKIQITVEVVDIIKASYFKYPTETQ